jgi:hypothetical protein
VGPPHVAEYPRRMENVVYIFSLNNINIYFLYYRLVARRDANVGMGHDARLVLLPPWSGSEEASAHRYRLSLVLLPPKKNIGLER